MKFGFGHEPVRDECQVSDWSALNDFSAPNRSLTSVGGWLKPEVYPRLEPQRLRVQLFDVAAIWRTENISELHQRLVSCVLCLVSCVLCLVSSDAIGVTPMSCKREVRPCT
jgi:hypothetical protein